MTEKEILNIILYEREGVSELNDMYMNHFNDISLVNDINTCLYRISHPESAPVLQWKPEIIPEVYNYIYEQSLEALNSYFEREECYIDTVVPIRFDKDVHFYVYCKEKDEEVVRKYFDKNVPSEIKRLEYMSEHANIPGVYTYYVVVESPKETRRKVKERGGWKRNAGQI